MATPNKKSATNHQAETAAPKLPNPNELADSLGMKINPALKPDQIHRLRKALPGYVGLLDDVAAFLQGRPSVSRCETARPSLHFEPPRPVPDGGCRAPSGGRTQGAILAGWSPRTDQSPRETSRPPTPRRAAWGQRAMASSSCARRAPRATASPGARGSSWGAPPRAISSWTMARCPASTQ